MLVAGSRVSGLATKGSGFGAQDFIHFFGGGCWSCRFGG